MARILLRVPARWFATSRAIKLGSVLGWFGFVLTDVASGARTVSVADDRPL